MTHHASGLPCNYLELSHTAQAANEAQRAAHDEGASLETAIEAGGVAAAAVELDNKTVAEAVAIAIAGVAGAESASTESAGKLLSSMCGSGGCKLS